MTKRKYRGTDTQMLMAAYLIAECGIEKAQLLSSRRPQWANPFFPNLKVKIDEAIKKNIGIDLLPHLMEATAEVKATIAAAHRAIMELKAEIEVGFHANPTRRSILLTELGYDRQPKKNVTQARYVQMLFTLRANLTPAVKAELVEAGVNPTAIDALLQLAHRLIEDNERQESLKVNRKSLNAKNIAELNALYDEVIAVCKLVGVYFADNQLLKEQFYYLSAVKAQGYAHTTKRKTSSSPKLKASPGDAAAAPTANVEALTEHAAKEMERAAAISEGAATVAEHAEATSERAATENTHAEASVAYAAEGKVNVETS